jgi:glutamate-1-semialdehyde 2,1-aminomutase
MRARMLPTPLFFERAHGSCMWDVDGHQLLDYVLGWGAIVLGHCHPDVTRAVQEQAARGELYGAQHRLEFEVSEKVLSHVDFAERLLYSNTGSEAVQIAIRLARAFTGRQKFVKFVGHYHGWVDPVLVSYRPPAGSAEASLETGGQNPRVLDDVLVARWNDRDSVRLVFERHGGEIAALIAEPVLCNSGVISPDPGFLEFLRETTIAAGSLLIFDEVITGYRVGLSGAAGRFRVAPDLATYGKAVANGYPLSIVAGRADIVDQVTTGRSSHAGTFNGNPIVLAAALATLTALEAPDVYPQLESRSRLLADGIRRVFETFRVPAFIHQVGAVVQVLPGALEAIHDYEGFAQADWGMYDDLIVELLRRNVFLLPGGRLYLSVAHTDSDVAATVAAFEDGLRVVIAGKQSK